MLPCGGPCVPHASPFQVGNVINNDPETKDLLQLYFLPDYNVTMAETIIPGGFHQASQA